MGGKQAGVGVDLTENVRDDFNEENLKKYNAVFFGTTATSPVQQAISNVIFKQAAGGISIHAASDTE
jgi:hypothetical protein